MRSVKNLLFVGLLIGLNSNLMESKETKEVQNTFEWNIDRFADVKIMRYKVPGFEELSLEKKKLIYYLSQAAVEGRDIIFDQNNKNNLLVRSVLEDVFENYSGEKNNADFEALEVYLKRIWFSNGIHHHYSMDKFKPGFSETFFIQQLDALPDNLTIGGVKLNKEEAKALLLKVIFDPEFDKKRVNQKEGEDLILSSANNYYGDGITQEEVENFYASKSDPNDKTPVSYGLNSRLEKENSQLKENVWQVGGMYSAAIEKIVYWLEKATQVTENEGQKQVIQHLISFYKTGDLQQFDTYNIAWLNDHASQIDFINGFIETYGDALGIKASWESIVNFEDVKASERSVTISSNAQWFEDHSPIDDRFRKKEVKGVTAKVITAAMLGGDCYPATPIGVNLPNADWIRVAHGSKSVTIENITYAYDQSKKGDGFMDEFAYSKEEIEKARKYAFMTDNLHTDLHECLGHGSGQLLPGVKGDELKAYGATIEEARADLFGLYYMMDEKMVELGLLPSLTATEAHYDHYMRNGLMTQLTRIQPGDDIEESHMRNRALIAQWTYQQGQDEKVVQKKSKNGETFFVINDYKKLRALFGELLSEIQRIKSEGDFEGARQLVENYAVKVDQNILAEVHERYGKLNLAPYGGFVNPVYETELDANGEIVDVKVNYTELYVDQMMRYSIQHGWLSRVK